MELPMRTCRLCLNIIKEGYKILDELSEFNLNTLLIYPNLAVTDNPLLCETCSDNLKYCLDFKAKCLLTKDRIPIVCGKNSLKRDLPDGFKSDMSECLSEDLSGYVVCHFCSEVVNSSSIVDLDSDTEMSLKYFPELHHDTIQRPAACMSCYKSLCRYFSFVKICMKTEENISTYCKVEDIECKSQAEWISVGNFKSINEPHRPHLIKLEKDDVKKDKTKCSEAVAEDLVSIKQELDIEMNIGEETNVEFLNSYSSQNNILATHQTNKYEEGPAKTVDSVKRYIKSDKNKSKISKHKCTECNFETNRKRNLLAHMLVHKSCSEVTMYKCTDCSYATKHKKNVKKHKLIHKSTDEKSKFECHLCGYQARLQTTLSKHMAVHKPSSTTISEQKDISSHKNSSDVAMYKCTDCTFETKYKFHLPAHMIVHNTEAYIHKCTECQYETKDKNRLKKHMIVHKSIEEVAVYICDVCGFQTKRKKSLCTHVLTHKRANEVEMYKCELCEYRAKRKDVLRQHMLTHKNMDEITSYRCETCGHQARRKNHMVLHMLSHKSNSEVPVFKCDLCNFETKYKQSFRKHNVTHRGVV